VSAEAQRASAPKPLLRGWIHAVSAPVALGLGVLLIVLAHGDRAKVGATVFLLTSTLLFGLSAIYHRFYWSERATAVLRRLDHANIFLMIAGTYTPIALTALPPHTGAIMLIVVWGGALLGIGFRVFWLGAPRWLYVGLYVLLGWIAVWHAGALVHASATGFLLVLAGGVLYMAGAVFYATRRPNLVPGVFGFHELFHACTVVAFGCQWAAALLYTTRVAG
jgi:hemolysin III